MQLSVVSHQCFGLTLAPGEVMIAVVCCSLFLKSDICCSTATFALELVYISYTIDGYCLFQVRSLDPNMLDQMYQARYYL